MLDQDQLSSLISQCIERDPLALKIFFEQLLSSEWIVPDRVQQQPLRPEVTYPSPLVSVLGVQSRDKIFVPVFSSTECLEEWFGGPALARTLKGSQILQMVPESWWVTINPGQELWMELSAWEVQELKLGVEAIPSVVTEHLSEDARPVQLIPLQLDEKLDLRRALSELCGEMSEIQKAFVAYEEFEIASGGTTRDLIVGLQVAPHATRDFERVSQRIHQVLDPLQIGAEPIKVFYGGSVDGTLALDKFRGLEPVYSRPGSWWSRLLGL